MFRAALESPSDSLDQGRRWVDVGGGESSGLSYRSLFVHPPLPNGARHSLGCSRRIPVDFSDLREVMIVMIFKRVKSTILPSVQTPPFINYDQ